MRPTAYADKTLRKSQDGVLYWRWFDEKTVHLSLQLRVSRYLKGDLLKEPDDEYRHLSRRFYWSGYFVRMMNCTTYHTSSTRNVLILDRGHSVMDDYVPLWLSKSSAY